jgi:predicted GIY-YIG superfamily endonuclease
MWYVYVIQSQMKRYSKSGKELNGFFYVGCTTDVTRRVKEHNGLKSGGGKYTSQYRPWVLKAVYGTYENRSEAMKAEMSLKKLRGVSRLAWSIDQSPYCRGLGVNDPMVLQAQCNPKT